MQKVLKVGRRRKKVKEEERNENEKLATEIGPPAAVGLGMGRLY
jgi:hypothetical protein